MKKVYRYPGRRAFQAKETASAKARKWEYAWCMQGRGRQPVKLQQNEPEGKADEGE